MVRSSFCIHFFLYGLSHPFALAGRPTVFHSLSAGLPASAYGQYTVDWEPGASPTLELLELDSKDMVSRERRETASRIISLAVFAVWCAVPPSCPSRSFTHLTFHSSGRPATSSSSSSALHQSIRKRSLMTSSCSSFPSPRALLLPHILPFVSLSSSPFPASHLFSSRRTTRRMHFSRWTTVFSSTAVPTSLT
jgi:hypothetical protein